MQYSDTTTKTGIIQLCEQLCKLGDGGISSNATLLYQFTNLINIAYWDVFMSILSVDSQWKADDFGYTDYPEAPISMVASQRDYTLPVASSGANVATLLRVNRVWILLPNGTTRLELDLMEPDYDPLVNTLTGTPFKYRLQGKSIYLDPVPTAAGVTLTNGLIIQFQRIPQAFAYTDTTKIPGFMQTYHDLLAFKASYLYMLPSEPRTRYAAGGLGYGEVYNERLELLKRDYARANDANRPQFEADPIRHR